VVGHVRDVLANVDALYGDSPHRPRLRLIALLHDAFKYRVDRRRPRGPTNTHEVFARRFAERYLDDEGVLEVIELHDAAYKAHRQLARTGDAAQAVSAARALAARLGSRLEIFLMFYLCDTQTNGKSMEHYHWFRRIACPGT
jgi:HD superfamily phosphodiesterase